MLPIAALTAGLTAGLVAGGRLRALAGLRFRHTPLVGVALGAQLLLGRVPGPVRIPLLLASCGAAGLWVLSNCRGRPRWLALALGALAAGWALNAAVIAANGGMPVSRHALDAAGASSGFEVEEGNLFKHVEADRSTALAPLGDVLAVPPLRAVVSAGDVLLFAGTAAAVALAMTGRAA